MIFEEAAPPRRARSGVYNPHTGTRRPRPFPCRILSKNTLGRCASLGIFAREANGLGRENRQYDTSRSA